MSGRVFTMDGEEVTDQVTPPPRAEPNATLGNIGLAVQGAQDAATAAGNAIDKVVDTAGTTQGKLLILGLVAFAVLEVMKEVRR